MSVSRVERWTWGVAVALALCTAVFLTLDIDLKGVTSEDFSWGASTAYLAFGALGVGALSVAVGLNAYWLWPLAVVMVSVVYETFLWTAPDRFDLTTDAIGAYPTSTLLSMLWLLPIPLVGAIIRVIGIAWINKRPPTLADLTTRGRGTSTRPAPNWPLLTSLVALGTVWFFYARWLYGHAGDRAYATLWDGACLHGNQLFATTQALIAATGLLAVAVAIGVGLRPTWPASRLASRSLAAVVALAVVWVVVAFAFAPDHSFDTLSQCGSA